MILLFFPYRTCHCELDIVVYQTVYCLNNMGSEPIYIYILYGPLLVFSNASYSKWLIARRHQTRPVSIYIHPTSHGASPHSFMMTICLTANTTGTHLKETPPLLIIKNYRNRCSHRLECNRQMAHKSGLETIRLHKVTSLLPSAHQRHGSKAECKSVEVHCYKLPVLFSKDLMSQMLQSCENTGYINISTVCLTPLNLPPR